MTGRLRRRTTTWVDDALGGLRAIGLEAVVVLVIVAVAFAVAAVALAVV